jgi:hypothetical protein
MTTTLNMLNDCLRRVGRPHVPALDTGGTSSQAEMERVIGDASRRCQTQGWWFNTVPSVVVSPDINNEIVVSAVAAVEVLHIDAIDDEPWNNFVVREGKLFNLDTKTNKFTAATKVRVVLLLPNSDLPEAFAQYVVSHAAFNYNRHFAGNPTRDLQLQAELLLAQSTVNREEIAASDVNLLNTYHARSVRGRPSTTSLLGYINGY